MIPSYRPSIANQYKLHDRILYDPKFFLESLVEIVNKETETVPFIFNPSQIRYYQNRTLRDIILKPRQLGFCQHPDTKVLTADLKWVTLRDIRIGQEVIAVDEFPLKKGKGTARKMRTAIIENKCSVFDDAIKITMEDGRILVATPQHRFFSKMRQGNEYGKNDGCGNATVWRQVKDFRISDEIRQITKPWDDSDGEDRWFGGVLDGEGSMRKKQEKSGRGICVGQQAGPLFDEMENYVKQKGYNYVRTSGPPRKGSWGKKIMNGIGIIRMDELFRMIGQTRPKRFINNRWWEGKELPGKGVRKTKHYSNINTGWKKVVKIEMLLKQEMIDLQTSEKTYIAEGFVSHNSTEVMGLFLHDTIFCPNTLSVVVAHTEKDASDLFEKAHFMFNSIPEIFRPSVGRSNIRELKFDKVNSKFTIGSAEAKHFGISKTINNLHITELSHPYYKEDFIIGLLESVPRSGRIVLESTARGEGNIFHRYYLGAKNKENEFTNHYYRWFEHDEYRISLLSGEKLFLTEEEVELINKNPKYFTHLNRMAKIKWRREKKSRLGKLFVQEYPEGEDDDSFIKSGSPVLDVELLRARDKELSEQFPQEIWLGGELYVYKIVEPGARYIIGCLPDGELIYTDNGIKKIEDVNINDKLFGKDDRLVNINNVYNRYYKGKLIGIKPVHASDPMYFTPEHPILVLKDNKEHRIRRKNIDKREYAKYLPTGIKIPETGQGPRFYYLDTTWKKANELTKKDILVFPIRYKGKELSDEDILKHFPDQSEIRIDRRLDPKIILNKDFWLFMGFYLAEGVLSKRVNGIGLCFGKHEYILRKKASNIIKTLFKRNSKRTEEIENKLLSGKTNRGIDVLCEVIYKFINENFGRYSDKKFIAEWIKYLPKKLKLKLFEGWVLGDGISFERLNNSEMKHTIGGVSVNKKMLMDFQDILLSLGFISGIGYVRKKHTFLRKKGTLIFGRSISKKDEWVTINALYSLTLAHRESCEILKELGYPIKTVFKRARHRAGGFIKDGYIYTKIKNLTEKMYNGIVHNFETEDHSYCCNLITAHNCDTSEGDINSDYSAAIVLRMFPPPVEQVALLHGRWTPDIFSEKIYKVGMAYNKAIMVVERNNHGHAVLLNLTNGIVRNGVVKYPTYPNIFAGPDRKLGWLTGINKVQMIQELAQAIRTGQLVMASKKFIDEAKKFSYLGGGKMGAPSGSYDDIVMSQALALMGILTGQFSVEFV